MSQTDQSTTDDSREASSVRRELRRQLHARRAALTSEQRRSAAETIAATLACGRWFRPGRRIGLYLNTDYELDTTPVLRLALQRNCDLWLPRITRSRDSRMCFSPLVRRLRRNRYGIAEPDTSERIRANELELIFLPLLGVDAQGVRLGMGAGYYDRLLAYRLRRHTWFGPTLIGLAYSQQKVAKIPAAAHDVPLDALVTECGIEYFNGASR